MRLWMTYLVLAEGNIKEGIMPVQWCAELVAKRLWPDRHAIIQDERMVALEAQLERIYRDNPKLAPSLEERIGPMKTLGIAGA